MALTLTLTSDVYLINRYLAAAKLCLQIISMISLTSLSHLFHNFHFLYRTKCLYSTVVLVSFIVSENNTNGVCSTGGRMWQRYRNTQGPSVCRASYEGSVSKLASTSKAIGGDKLMAGCMCEMCDCPASQHMNKNSTSQLNPAVCVDKTEFHNKKLCRMTNGDTLTTCIQISSDKIMILSTSCTALRHKINKVDNYVKIAKWNMDWFHYWKTRIKYHRINVNIDG